MDIDNNVMELSDDAAFYLYAAEYTDRGVVNQVLIRQVCVTVGEC